MNTQTFYKLGSLFLGVFSLVLLFLIVAPYAEGYDVDDTDMTFEDELRMHRQNYIQVANSKSPYLSAALKSDCLDEIEKINAYLYEENVEVKKEEEYDLRREINSLNLQITNEENYPTENQYIGPMYFKM